MRKKWIALSLFPVLFLMGCSGGQDVSSITIDKDGTVKSYIVEDFTASYYDAEELKLSVSDDILTFNEQYEETAIELTKFESEEGVVRATVEYKNAEVYEEFNEETMFVGLVVDALAEDYVIEGEFYSVKDMENALSFAEINDENYHIMIFTEPVNVKTPGKVLYVSDGLEKGSSSKKVTVTDNTKEIYYIIYE